MKSKDNKIIVVKKRDFLESLYVVYENASEEYLTALIDGLQLIRKHKFYEHINFDDYKGRISI